MLLVFMDVLVLAVAALFREFFNMLRLKKSWLQFQKSWFEKKMPLLHLSPKVEEPLVPHVENEAAQSTSTVSNLLRPAIGSARRQDGLAEKA